MIMGLILAVLFVCGFSTQKEPVDLLKSKLIDLDKAIDLAQWGAKPEADSEDESEEDADSQATSGWKTVTGVEESAPKTIKVRVHGTKAFLDGEECKPEELEEKIRALCTGNESVLLLDDYAEAHVYRDADRILSRLMEEIGFSYEAE